MVAPIENNHYAKIPKKQSKPVKTSIFYINDLHGQTAKMERLITASSNFDSFEKQKKNTDKLKLCSGDVFIGENSNINRVCLAFLNLANIDAMTLGNHEFDMKTAVMGKLFKDNKFDTVTTNLNFTKPIELQKEVIKSAIKEINGNQYGLIGLQPLELMSSMRLAECVDGVYVDENKERTLVAIQKQINKFQAQGINKIILLSHTGNKFEKEIAQKVIGLDIILGGHSHDLIKGIKEGKNLFYSEKGEPVVITQAGKDGENFGVLNLEFDENGKITKVQNNIASTLDYSPNELMKMLNGSIMGGKNVVTKLIYKDKIAGHKLVSENPFANLFSDAVKSYMQSDIVFTASGNIRGELELGDVRAVDIFNLTPFKNKTVTYYLTEPQVVDVIAKAALSITKPDFKPGIIQVSGLRYTINKKGDLKELVFVDKNGIEKIINIENPNPNKKYLIASDDFVATNRCYPIQIENRAEFIRDEDFDKDFCTIEYLKKLGKTSLEIRKDNRIKIID